MNDATTMPLADTSDMAQVHRVFRDALGAAAPLVGSVAPGDADRVEMVGSYYANVLEFLRVHHEGEDDLLWSKLVQRVPDQADTIQRIAAQHHGVHAALDAANEKLAEWRTAPTVDSAAALAASLATLGAELASHLDEEERVIVPMAATCITAPEWGELPGHAMQHFSGDKIWLILGLVQEQFRPEQIAMMEAHMPPPVLDFWTNVGRGQFEEFVRELRA